MGKRTPTGNKLPEPRNSGVTARNKHRSDDKKQSRGIVGLELWIRKSKRINVSQNAPYMLLFSVH